MSKLLLRRHFFAMASMCFFLTSLSGQNEAEAEGDAPVAGKDAVPAAGGDAPTEDNLQMWAFGKDSK